MTNANSSKKVALITGGAQRIGATIAQTLHQADCNIIVHYHQSSDAADELLSRLNEQRPESAIKLQQNLLQTEELDGMVEQAAKHWGKLDILINNASSFYSTPIGEIKENNWHELFGSNIKAPLFLCQAAASYLKSTHGTIINMIDIHAERPMRKHTVYSAAKAALSSITKSLARELAPEVRVNGIAPGAILWPDQEMPDKTKSSILQRIALNRCGEPEDIARAIKFLVFDAPYITGQILAVDGGRSLTI